jgi:hypothetical protein
VAEPLEALGVPWHLQSFLILIFFCYFSTQVPHGTPEEKNETNVYFSFTYTSYHLILSKKI